MKKIFAFMMFAGLVLAMATAGGFDSGIISTGRICMQSALSALLILSGGMMLGRGQEA